MCITKMHFDVSLKCFSLGVNFSPCTAWEGKLWNEHSQGPDSRTLHQTSATKQVRQQLSSSLFTVEPQNQCITAQSADQVIYCVWIELRRTLDVKTFEPTCSSHVLKGWWLVCFCFFQVGSVVFQEWQKQNLAGQPASHLQVWHCGRLLGVRSSLIK